MFYSLDRERVKPYVSARGGHMRRRPRHISQTQIDFLCLSVFGLRALPDAMAERIALRRELARGVAEAAERAAAGSARRGGRHRLPLPEAPLEAVGAVG